MSAILIYTIYTHTTVYYKDMVNTKRILLFCLTKQKQNNRKHKMIPTKIKKTKKCGTFKNKKQKEMFAIVSSEGCTRRNI